MFLRHRRTRKVIAVTLLTIMLTNTIAPTVVYALTSGPKSPEASSFEPVDTTDMVNLLTGDFTYNLPLLEVPGSEGGYPLSLSYHAGIQPNADASWVGLGWALNPGAINRNVNGYPDDYNNVSYIDRTYWSGGSTTTYSVGVTIGFANSPVSVSFGLSFAQDTYRGFGVGYNMGIGMPITGGLGMGVGIGVDPYSNGDLSSFSAGLSLSSGSQVGSGNMVGGINLGMSTNFSSTSLNGGVSVSYNTAKNYNGNSTNFSALGVDIGSGGKGSVTVGGILSGVYNSNSNKISTKSNNFSFGIPLPGVTINIGYNYTRYWTDELTSIGTYGNLYLNNVGLDLGSFDSYELLDNSSTAWTNTDNDPFDPSKVQGGSFPDVDDYIVTAQGVSGNMTPFLYQGHTASQLKKDASGNDLVRYYIASAPGVSRSVITNNKPYFRFKNDFANYYRQNNLNYQSSDLTNLINVTAPFDPNPTYYAQGYDVAKKKLAGSKNIEYYTNTEINNGVAKSGGFIAPNNAAGFLRATTIQYTKKVCEKLDHGWGGCHDVLITDNSLGDQIGGFSITNESGVTYHYGLPAYSSNEIMYSEKISQTQGLVYNKLSKPKQYAYIWYLTSITGPDFVDRDGDGKAGINDWGYWVNFDYGKWTDKYNWRNPFEGFHKDLDNKFKNVSMGTKEIYYLNSISTRSHTAFFEKEMRDDGLGAPNAIFAVDNTNGKLLNSTILSDVVDANSKVLALRKIYLVSNSNATLFSNSAGTISYLGNFGTNILDKADVDANRNAIESAAIRVIDFNYDYNLCKGVKNNLTGTGKLTLQSILLRGIGGFSSMPAITFSYELNSEETLQDVITTTTGGAFTSTTWAFTLGTMLMSSNNEFLGVVAKVSGNTYYLKGGTVADNTTYSVKTTKNPIYNKDAYDVWGLYKPDVDVTSLNIDENNARLTTLASANASDAWCLRGIRTGTGSDIRITYEPDTYSKTIFNTSRSFVLNNIVASWNATDNAMNYTCDVEANGYNLNEFINLNDEVNLLTMMFKNWLNPTTQIGDYTNLNGFIIKSINQNNITIRGPIGVTNNLYVTNTSSTANYCVYIAGNIFISSNTNATIFGGGLRVGSIKVKNSTNNQVLKTSYNYSSNITGKTSGVTSYEPVLFPAYKFSISVQDPRQYITPLYKRMGETLALAREMPPPGVMYEYVKVMNSIKNQQETLERELPGKTEYQFEVPSANMVNRNYIQIAGGSYVDNARNLTVQSSASRIGNLKKITQYDNNGKKLSETINQYLHDDIAGLTGNNFYSAYEQRLLQFNYQGLIKQRFSNLKKIKYASGLYAGTYGSLATMSTKEDFPNIMIGKTVVNYKTGIKTSSTTLAFDMLSGSVTKKVETDEYGNRFLTQVVPAYTKYPEMGLKLSNQANKNMLSQEAETYVYKVDGNNNPVGLVSAMVQTWSKNIPAIQSDGTLVYQNTSSSTPSVGLVYRKEAAYAWMSDYTSTDGINPLQGPTPQTTPTGAFYDFNFTTPSASDAQWKKTGEITLYNVYSKALESKDINGNFAATKLGYNNSYTTFTGSPAKYDELFYTGFEENSYQQQGLSILTANGAALETATTYPTQNAKTGYSSLKIPPGTGGVNGATLTIPINKLVSGRDYLASVWITAPYGTNAQLSYQVDAQSVIYNSAPAAGMGLYKSGKSWQLATLKIPSAALSGGTNLKITIRNPYSSWTAHADDFRFQPMDASSNAYVYENGTGALAYIIGDNGLATRYLYDGHGRLIKTFTETFTKGTEFLVSENSYNDAKYGNDAIVNGSYQKTNCSSGCTGSYVTVNVPADMFTSYLSKNDANSQAQTYAQTLANNDPGGTCTCQTIYARMEYVETYNYDDGICYTENGGTYTIHFYSDYNCTIPLSVNGLLVSYSVFDGTNTTNYTVSCTGTITTVATGVLVHGYDYCYGINYNGAVYNLTTGLGGYTIR